MARVRVIQAAAMIASACTAEPQLPDLVADRSYEPYVPRPEFGLSRGPLVCIDEAHFNQHTASGRYGAFASLLTRDGYSVTSSVEPFDQHSLSRCSVLVIANAQPRTNQREANGSSSAFEEAEISAVESWVHRGGALLLIVDHAPIPRASQLLATRFDVELRNGIVAVEGRSAPLLFERGAGLIGDHAITVGRRDEERIETVATYSGCALRTRGPSAALLVLHENAVSVEMAPAMSQSEAQVEVGGWLQGAAIRHGRGRVAVFGEAAMFTAQILEPDGTKVGLSAPEAAHNAQFVLNLLHWLSGLLGE